MRSYWFILLGSAAVSLGLFVPLVWRYRREFARGFKETWGIAVAEDVVMQERVDALRNASPMGWLAIVELTAITCAAIVAFAIGAYNGGVIAMTCFVLAVALIVLFNAVLLAQMPPLPDRVEPQLPGGLPDQDTSPRVVRQGPKFRPRAWWLVCAVICLLLVVGGLVAAATGDLTVRLILGVPGALGLLGLGLRARRSRGSEPAPWS
jgi:hypothetical protein